MATKKNERKPPSKVYLEWPENDFEMEPVEYSNVDEIEECMIDRDGNRYGEMYDVYEYVLVKKHRVGIQHTEKFVMEKE